MTDTSNVLRSLFICLLSISLCWSCTDTKEPLEKIDTSKIVVTYQGKILGSTKRKKIEVVPPKKQNTEVLQPKTAHNLDWLSFNEIAKSPPSGSKKYLVDIYTPWCGWCKMMDKNTFSDKAVQKYIKQNFNLVKFNAESKEDVFYKGKAYSYIGEPGKKGVNELAAELLQKRLSYPTLVYMNERMEVIEVSPGYKNPEQLLQEMAVIAKS